MALEDDEKRRIAKVIWTYSGKTQPEFEVEVGLKGQRLRSMISPTGGHSVPSLDELVMMAEAAGVPRDFALDGWAAADPIARLDDQVSDLRRSVRNLTGQVVANRRAIQELRGRDRPEEPPGDEPQ